MRKTILQEIYALCFTAILLFGMTVQPASSEGLGGRAFTDPSQQFQMPEDWIKKTIKYDSWADRADLAVTLDQHLYPAFLPFIEKFAGERNLHIAVKEGTCGISAGMLMRKTVDMAGFCCPPGKADRLPGLRFHTLGIAPLGLLVHLDNPIGNLSLEQARRVFQGEVYRWSELRGGGNLPIQTVGRLHCKTRPGHWRLLLDNEDLFSPRLQEVGAIADMIAKVSANPRSIGYEVIWMTQRYQQRGKVKALKIDGYSPMESEPLLSGGYPLYRAFNISTWEGKGIANPLAEELADYLLKQVEHLDKRYGIVPVSRLRKSGWKFLRNELVGEPR